MKNCTQINHWIYHYNIYQPPHSSLKIRMPITFQSYCNCIEMKQGWWRSFGESNNIFHFLTVNYIYLYNKYLYYGNKGKYIRSNDGTFTRWHDHVCTTPFTTKQKWHKLLLYNLKQRTTGNHPACSTLPAYLRCKMVAKWKCSA